MTNTFEPNNAREICEQLEHEGGGTVDRRVWDIAVWKEGWKPIRDKHGVAFLNRGR